MSRNVGDFIFPANFEVTKVEPLDGRQLVGTKADLTGATTWNQSGGVWLFDGAIVAVGSDSTPTNNGIYFLKDAVNYDDINSWEKVEGGSGISNLTGATNGLSLFNVGTCVGLGGILSGATDISGAQSLSFGLNTPLTKFGVSATTVSVSSTTIDISGTVKLLTIPAVGTVSDDILVRNASTGEIKTITGGAVLSVAVTGATNGVCKYNSNNVCLGGTLSAPVTITTGGNLFKLCGGNGNYFQENINTLSWQVSGATGCVYSTASGTGTYSLSSTNGSNLAYLTISPACSSIFYDSASLQICANCATFTDGNNSQGLVYGGNYEGNFVPRSLVTAQYVTGYTQCASNTVSVCNIVGNYTATTTNDYIGVNGGTAVCVLLPTGPKLGQRISVADVCGNALADNITVCGNGICINGDPSALINTDYGSMTFINNGIFWSAVAFIN